MTPSELAEIEAHRLRVLVAVDMDGAEALHAEDFQLIPPGGNALSRGDYLGAVASGEINYIAWEPDEIDASVRGDAGCVRYRSTIHIIVSGEEFGPSPYWHTDYYENRDGRWQVLWSQATEARV